MFPNRKFMNFFLTRHFQLLLLISYQKQTKNSMLSSLFRCQGRFIVNEIQKNNNRKRKKRTVEWNVKCEKWNGEFLQFFVEKKSAQRTDASEIYRNLLCHLDRRVLKHEHCKLYANISETSCFRKFFNFPTAFLLTKIRKYEQKKLNSISFTLLVFCVGKQQKQIHKFHVI